MQHPVWLGESREHFPPSQLALKEPNGLLAVGGDLHPERLLNAYARGIFPWFNEEDPVLWWTPNPRLVFIPSEIHISKSLQKTLRKTVHSVTLDRGFDEVIHNCSALREHTTGTWISEDIIEAYTELHHLGFAHSIEYRDATGTLQGGFYGIGLGAVFFGESMFSLTPNASKMALSHFAAWAHANGFALIDGQVENPHLVSLGAKTISRDQFEQMLKTHCHPYIDAFQNIWDKARGITIGEGLGRHE